MKMAPLTVTILQSCDEANHDKLPIKRVEGKGRPESANSSDTSFYSSSQDSCGTVLSKAIEQSIRKRMRHVDADSEHGEKFKWEDLIIGRLLGEGAFSSVHCVSICNGRAADSSLRRETYALKFLHMKCQTHKIPRAAADLAFEAKLLASLNHENIIKIRGMAKGCPSQSYKNGRGGFFLVLDLLSETLEVRLFRWKVNNHKDLFERLESTAIGITKAMEYLHQKRIVVHDLKPQNIGYDRVTGQVKLFDLGLATELQPGETIKSTVGTFRYMAPETILGKGHGLPCDVYAFGIVLYQIVALETRKFAYKCKTRAELIEWVVKRGGRPSLRNLSFPERLKWLIKGCWHPNPNDRPTFPTILRRLETIMPSLIEDDV
jgi:serine/threonine protein kinase